MHGIKVTFGKSTEMLTNTRILCAVDTPTGTLRLGLKIGTLCTSARTPDRDSRLGMGPVLDCTCTPGGGETILAVGERSIPPVGASPR